MRKTECCNLDWSRALGFVEHFLKVSNAEDLGGLWTVLKSRHGECGEDSVTRKTRVALRERKSRRELVEKERSG